MSDLIDKYLPNFQFEEVHAIEIHAPRQKIFSALQHYDAQKDWLIASFIALREIPLRLLQACKLLKDVAPTPFNLDKFTLLETLEDNQIAFGLVGKFWKANYGLEMIADGEAFCAFDKPNNAKLAMQFKIDAIDGDKKPSCQNRFTLQTKTRVFCLDGESKRRFTPYWYLIRPVSGLIRKRMLKAIKQQSETTTLP
ncbi:hypothetical protein N5853_14215 (plasmid) [Bartonella sp. HY329]|uniref:hypothetical protein n=1 Tax=unclassified Bartonella TaxID=2645622 RepID=UPI0021C86CDD|nr:MULTISPECIES: hypothetical protein [unclassified Bartonella]UXM96470.1 hypothetical protein N5853_14215 [Bartonella sp. HY329]UXN10793.1 hypothetical protein N5852_14220 [Bartonella sp. HY328]